MPIVELTHPDDRVEHERRTREVAQGDGDEFSLEQRYVRKDGRVVWVEINGKVERDERGAPTNWAATVVDLTERKKTESELRTVNQRLHDLATRDALTEVLNRRGLEDALRREVARSGRTGDPLTVILLDCDDFKRVNDEFGHAVGDLVLREVAWRLKGALRPMDLVGRVGGDEFMALLPGLEIGLGKVVAERLRLGVGGQPVLANPEPVSVTVSAGLSEVAASTRSIQELLQLTRLAIRRAKRGGRNQVIGSNTLTNRFDPRAVLATAIGGDLDVFAHALVELDGDDTEVGHELLIRGPQGPFREPKDLFRLATSEQMGTALDHACLRRSVEMAKSLRLQGRLHINLLPSTLLALPLQQLIDDLSDPPSGARFFIELSEQQYLGDPRIGPIRGVMLTHRI